MSGDIFVARVSDIEAFRYFYSKIGDDYEQDQDEVLARLRGEEVDNKFQDAMLAGTLGHLAIEKASLGEEIEYPKDDENKIALYFKEDFEVELLPMKEQRMFKTYDLADGDKIVVSGKYDGKAGKRLVDYKFSGRFDVEGKYIDSIQWPLYLDLAGDATEFEYSVFLTKEASDRMVNYLGLDDRYKNFVVYDHNSYVFNKYPGMDKKVHDMVQWFYNWSKKIGWGGRTMEELEGA